MNKMSVKLATLTSSLLFAAAAQAQSVDIKITNLTQNLHFTPLLVTAHKSSADLFEVGTSASAPLQEMAEGGSIASLVDVVTEIGASTAANPAQGLLGPAMSTMVADLEVTGQEVLSIVGMVLPTNDGFVGLDSWRIPKYSGTYTLYLNAYDAGTEANDELITGGGAPGVAGIPANPAGSSGTGGSGVATTEPNPMVHIHPGNLGDTNPQGGASDLDSRVHRWLNPVAKVVITVKD